MLFFLTRFRVASIRRSLLLPSNFQVSCLHTTASIAMPVPRAGVVQDQAIVFGDPSTVLQYLATFRYAHCQVLFIQSDT
jgi:hypothetical protein